jgi:predicted Zn finger-like uncharacterized protein
LLTQCPNCQTTFRVTSEILRVAEGQVRCGRCQTQFDAMERLIDEALPGSDVETGRFLRPPRPAPSRNDFSSIQVEEPDEQEDITLEGRHIEISGTYRVPDDTDASGRQQQLRQTVTEEWVEIDDLAADEIDATAVEDEDFGTLSDELRATAGGAATPEDIYEEDVFADGRANTILATDDDDLVNEGLLKDIFPPGNDAAGNGLADEEYAADDATGNARDIKFDSNVGDVIARAAAQAAALRVQPREVEPIFAPSRRLMGRGPTAPVDEELDILNPRGESADTLQQADLLQWKWLTAPLVLVLLLQAIHHYRADLARHPQIGEPLMNLYGALHLPLTPEWELHAYEIKQWGVLSDPASPGTLKVRASITNRADFAQPYPLLKMVLEDRWGDQVRAREFEPAEYLDPGTSPDRLLGPQQQATAIINIVDPGPDAEGFRFDVCLRGRAGPVCAADVPE